ncbi:magnesium transporter CorA family protein [Bacillus spizizenii]|uniref:magnesium transporter CorA family protein n=1 Tax=Bacillus subtilis group TaxID=653685 RepID=UPI00165B6130|nr:MULTISPECIES: magnesium transporter CorA family protein [Bacillus subtilis group]MCY9086567.1 magnesium transporter CorA family protein [Bacillus inaquosorum]MEC0724668.1 magnesium transporter CorA family protein [Bacillus spizizenii]MEC1599840.1 magnesium transporter CorA family protein [Bacillus spizizenii]MEC1643568.1 magnesium transporter CorA family protein [Bacillus spizizenii]
MITSYKTSCDGALEAKENLMKNSWINITSPTKNELKEISQRCNIPIEFLENPLDLEESARIEYDEETNSTLIINDFPTVDPNNNQFNSYITIPIGIILGTDYIVTVCHRPSNFLESLIKKNVNTSMKSRFALEILLSISTQYLDNLKQLNKHRLKIESNLRDSLTNRQLYDLMEIEKSLVYFLTSLKANGDVLRKLFITKHVKFYASDKELLEEVKIENTQGIETTELYTRILNSITSSYSSLISNELNNTMKTLTLFTVFLTLPTLVFSFFGMNVTLPIADKEPFSWIITLMIALIFIIWIGVALWRRRMF